MLSVSFSLAYASAVLEFCLLALDSVQRGQLFSLLFCCDILAHLQTSWTVIWQMSPACDF